MINLVWSGLLALLLLSGCGWNGTPTRANDFVPLTSIEITAVSPTIAALTSAKLTVKGNFSGLFTRDITDQAVWSSNSPAVANFITAANKNRVTGIAPGTATLTATVGGVSDTFTLTVSSATVTSMAITPAAASVPQGLTTQFTVLGTFSDLTTQDLTFDASWLSSNTAVATVSDAIGSKGLAKAVAATGTATITATFTGVSGSALLTATEPVPQSITVTPANPSMLSLSSGSFQATGHYSDGTTQDITTQVSWTSSSPAIATISSGGAAATLSQGTTTITASLNGVNGTTNLKVTGGTLTGFSISPTTATLVTGTVARMTVTGDFGNGIKRDITGLVALSTADPALATVTKPGGNLAWLNAIAATPLGTPTTVTATLGTLTAQTNLTVSAATPLSLVITPTSQNLIAGISTRFTATATFNGAPAQDVTASTTWSSGNGAVTVDNTTEFTRGRIRAAAAGSTNINATYAGVAAAPVTVTVTAPTLLAPIVSVNATLFPGNQVKYTATANGQDVTEDTTWSIDNSKVAFLADSTNQPGQVVGVDSGQTILRATFGGNTATAQIIIP